MDDLAVRIRAIADEIHRLQRELAGDAGPVRQHRSAVAARFGALYERLQDFMLVHHPTPLLVRGRRLHHHAPRPD